MMDAAGFDPYAILDVPAGNFNNAKVKRAYRKLAMKYHPDKVDPAEIDPEKASKIF